ncbi:MAG: DUF692 family multinuclear iron-containing protein [Myxococcota bacterium]|nr:DUF692 family multinuclear iron-containing protein [Myxococcota bacterium]
MFLDRCQSLPFLGVGVSTEYGAHSDGIGLDPNELAEHHPEFGQFLEIGVEVSKGLDQVSDAWLNSGRPCTYHFLDINLDDPADFDAQWLAEVRTLADRMKPAWFCGDAGLWHFGRRERGHMLLLPPVLSDESAKRFAEGICTLRDATGLEVLPENPPGQVFLGDLHIAEFFARVCEYADTGLLLDAAHLAIYQRINGHGPTIGLDHLDPEIVIEIHVAGASIRTINGMEIVEDDHTPHVLPDTWLILNDLAPRAINLRALVLECERNPLSECLGVYRSLQGQVSDTPFGRKAFAR